MGLPFEIFDAALTGSFQPTTAFLLPDGGETATLDFLATFSVAGKIEWYLEFCFGDGSNVAEDWYREVSQENVGNGVVTMAEVIRTLTANGGGNLGAGVHKLDTQLRRKSIYCRAQVRASAGTVTNLKITAVFGDPII